MTFLSGGGLGSAETGRLWSGPAGSKPASGSCTLSSSSSSSFMGCCSVFGVTSTVLSSGFGSLFICGLGGESFIFFFLPLFLIPVSRYKSVISTLAWGTQQKTHKNGWLWFVIDCANDGFSENQNWILFKHLEKMKS